MAAPENQSVTDLLFMNIHKVMCSCLLIHFFGSDLLNVNHIKKMFYKVSASLFSVTQR